MEWFNKVLHFIHQKLTNPHHIKVGDIVRYKGIELRVMRINTADDSAILSEWHSWECVPLRKLKLVKSIKSSDFKPGDMVKVNDVTYGEMDTYDFDWAFVMDRIIESGKEVEVIRVESRPGDGQIVVINWQGLLVPFMAYHIELVIDYDII